MKRRDPRAIPPYIQRKIDALFDVLFAEYGEDARLIIEAQGRKIVDRSPRPSDFKATSFARR